MGGESRVIAVYSAKDGGGIHTSSIAGLVSLAGVTFSDT